MLRGFCATDYKHYGKPVQPRAIWEALRDSNNQHEPASIIRQLQKDIADGAIVKRDKTVFSTAIANAVAALDAGPLPQTESKSDPYAFLNET